MQPKHYLRCISDYKSSLGQFRPGDVASDPALIEALKKDSPLSFVEHEEYTVIEGLDEAPEHRAVTRGRRAKA